MLTTRMTNCTECGDITALIVGIDCKITELGNDIYNKLIYALNGTCRYDEISSLIHYRRILVHKWCNYEYVSDFTVLQIASKVRLMTSSCIPQECCNECITTITTTTV